MKTLHNCILMLMFISSIPTVRAKEKTSNCEKDEAILFSCSTAKKMISFCASPNGIHPANLEYRFGTPTKIELRYKVVEKNPNTKINRADVLGASGASTAIWFENNDVAYVLGDPVKGNATLEIVRQRKLVTRLICKSDFFGDTSIPSTLIQQKGSEDFFELYGIE